MIRWSKYELDQRARQIAKDNGLTMDDWSIMADTTGWLTLEVHGGTRGKKPGDLDYESRFVRGDVADR